MQSLINYLVTIPFLKIIRKNNHGVSDHLLRVFSLYKNSEPQLSGTKLQWKKMIKQLTTKRVLIHLKYSIDSFSLVLLYGANCGRLIRLYYNGGKRSRNSEIKR